MSSSIRRLDHVAILVRSTSEALLDFRDRLGLEVVHVEEQPSVRLTYLDCGNTYLQLIEPLDATSELARSLQSNGEGLHHICFGADDAWKKAAQLAPDGAPVPPAGSGRGRVSAFVTGQPMHGVRVECTDFRPDEDVDAMRGWLG